MTAAAVCRIREVNVGNRSTMHPTPPAPPNAGRGNRRPVGVANWFGHGIDRIDRPIAEHISVGIARVLVIVAVLRERDDTGRIRAAHPATQAALVTADQPRDVVARRPLQRQRIVLVAEVVRVRMPRQILDRAVAFPLHPGQPRSEDAVDDRTRQHAVLFLQSVVAGDHLRFAFELVGRLLVDEVHRTADRVTAVQRALRTPQHFDPFDVEQTAFARGDTEVFRVHAVGVGRDARVTTEVAEVPADAADRHVVWLNHRRRNHVLQVFGVADTEVFEHLTGERRDRNRRVTDARFFTFRRDDHFLDLAPFRRRFGRCRGGCVCG